jgi:hypothetical protein
VGGNQWMMIIVAFGVFFGLGLTQMGLKYGPKYAYEGQHRAAPTVSAAKIKVSPSNGKRRHVGGERSFDFAAALVARPNKHSVAYLGQR